MPDEAKAYFVSRDFLEWNFERLSDRDKMREGSSPFLLFGCRQLKGDKIFSIFKSLVQI